MKMGDTVEITVCVVMICLFVAVTVTTLISIISNKDNRHLRIAFRDTADIADIVSRVESKGCTILGIDRDEDLEISEETESNLVE